MACARLEEEWAVCETHTHTTTIRNIFRNAKVESTVGEEKITQPHYFHRCDSEDPHTHVHDRVSVSECLTCNESTKV